MLPPTVVSGCFLWMPVFFFITGPSREFPGKLQIKAAARELGRGLLAEMLGRHLREAGVGSISAVIDAEPPNNSSCIAQGWSIAEIIRF
jgi:Amylo-alpha-1,6-glucosidase